jgi:hypothetical protein
VSADSFTIPAFPKAVPGGISFSRDAKKLLATGDTDIMAVAPESWNGRNAMLPKQLSAELDRFQFTPGVGIMEFDTIDPAELPRTFVFKTRQGSVGLLQVNGITTNASGVKFRYKLVQRGSQEKEAEPETQHLCFGPPFVARLPQGSVELIAVATAGKFFPDTNQVRTWWRPDGTLITNFDFAGLVSGGRGDRRDTNFIYRKIILQSKGLPADASDMQIEASDPSMGASWSEALLNGRPAPNTLFGDLEIPAEAKTLHLKIGVAAGPWTQNELLRIPQADMESSDIQFNQDRILWSAFIQSIEGKNGSTKVIASHTDVAGWQSQLIIVDFAGKEWPLLDGETSGGLCYVTAVCDGLKLSQVKEIHFRIRPYQSVEFSNVSLQPGYRTAVSVKDSDE